MLIRFAKARNPATLVDMRLKDRQHMVLRFAKPGIALDSICPALSECRRLCQSRMSWWGSLEVYYQPGCCSSTCQNDTFCIKQSILNLSVAPATGFKAPWREPLLTNVIWQLGDYTIIITHRFHRYNLSMAVPCRCRRGNMEVGKLKHIF